MRMQVIPAPAALAPQVLGVCVVRGTGAPQRFAMPAHALAVFTVVLRGRLQSVSAPGAAMQAGDLAATGCATQAQEFIASADLLAASLLCRATVLPLLHGESAHRFSDASAPQGPLSEFALDRWCRHAHAVDDNALAAALFRAVAKPLAQARPRASAERFARALALWGGAPQGVAQGAPAGWSERNWQRACQAELGLSPKRLQRLVRLHASVHLRGTQPGMAWAALAAEGGFSDQAHLAREFRLLGGVRPGSLAQPGQPLDLSTSVLVPRFFAG